MEIEPLFMEQRWAILRHLADGKLSPLQLANATKTSIANMSQQLRLLEMSDIVKKEKIPNRDKGKPRTLFSLSNEYAYVVSLMDNFVEKKLLTLEDSKKALLRIWFIEDKKIQNKVESLYHQLFPIIHEIDSLAVDTSKGKINVIISSGKPKQVEDAIKKMTDYTFKVFSNDEILRYVTSNKSKIIEPGFIVLLDENSVLIPKKLASS